MQRAAPNPPAMPPPIEARWNEERPPKAPDGRARDVFADAEVEIWVNEGGAGDDLDR